MILKKKFSAITAMMVLLGGVLCNSDSVASTKRIDFSKFFQNNQKTITQVMPNTSGKHDKNKDLQDNDSNNDAPKSKINIIFKKCNY